MIKIDIVNDKTNRGQSNGCDLYQIIAKNRACLFF